MYDMSAVGAPTYTALGSCVHEKISADENELQIKATVGGGERQSDGKTNTRSRGADAGQHSGLQGRP